MNAPRFVYTAHAARVLFGMGRLAELGDEIDRLGWRRAMLLCTRGQREAAAQAEAVMGSRLAALHDGARMHVPVETLAPALALAAERGVDGLVCFGGGSTIGLAKAMALQTRLPILAVPTTYAGSEMTPIHGITEGGVKRTGQDPVVLPKVVLYDPALTLGLPPSMSVTSGLNAIAHAAEGLYARDANPVVSMMAEEGARSLAGALPALCADPSDLAARAEALKGAWLCGSVLGSVGMALHHKLCHTLGGSFALPHAETHAIVLPHALAYNASAAPEAMAALGRAFAVESAQVPSRLHALLAELGVPVGLRELGMPREGIDRALEIALSNPYWNPRPLDRTALRGLLERAWEGSAP